MAKFEEVDKLPPISSASEKPEVDWFKGEHKSGDVYRVFNPAKLVPYEDNKGRLWVTRPKPTLVKKKDGGSTKKPRKSIF